MCKCCYGGRGGVCTIGCLYRRVYAEEEGASEMCVYACVHVHVHVHVCIWGRREGDSEDITDKYLLILVVKVIGW